MYNIRENERIDDLQFKGLKLIQNSNQFCFGLDAVLLARFSSPKDIDKIIDLGTGTGIIPVMVSGLCGSCDIVGLEIQECMCEMANRSVIINSLEKRVKIISGDIKNISSLFEKAAFSLVISNPPYIKHGNGIVNGDEQKAISRHEVLCNLDDVCKAAGYLLSDKGRFSMVHKPERIIECFDSMRKYSIEPKKAQLVYPKESKAPSAVLIEGVKGANSGFTFLRPIIVMDNNDSYTCSITDIYSGKGDEIFK